MLWNQTRLLDDRAARFRGVHEAWLTRAIRAPGAYPRIPTRRVDRGGFSGLMARAPGRRLADLWWARALGRVDLEG